MHIHKPKGFHNLKEFMAEISVIIVGILIALSAEQLIEWIHIESKLSETREALRAELSIDAANLKAMNDENACADARLNLLQDWSDGKVQVNTAHLASMQSRPLLWTLPITAWEVTESTGVMAHMPIKERLAYAEVYDELANERTHIWDERRAWDLLARYAGKTTLDPLEARTLKADLGTVRIRDDDRRLNTPSILAAIGHLGIQPGSPPQGRDPQELCQAPK